MTSAPLARCRADQSNHYYREMFRYLNGLLVPGGTANLQDSGYAAAARALWKIANDHSDVRS